MNYNIKTKVALNMTQVSRLSAAEDCGGYNMPSIHVSVCVSGFWLQTLYYVTII